MIPIQQLKEKYKEQFDKIYPNRPDKKGVGSSRYTNCFWLYAITKHLNPSLIIESGTWKGQSSWIFRQASNKSTIACFDIDFSNLKWKSDRIIYNQFDWTEVLLSGIIEPNHLIFFDDHISQKQRLTEAYMSGFKRLIFDDNLPDSLVKTKKNPASPTLQQLYSINSEVTELIKTYQILPQLNDEPNTYITYVELI